MKNLLGQPLHVINIGIASFSEPIRAAGAGVTHLDWSPPAQGDRALGDSLARLVRHLQVEQANEQAFAAYGAASPVLEGIGMARDCLPGMQDRMILHAGPPIAWKRMCGPMQGAIVGALGGVWFAVETNDPDSDLGPVLARVDAPLLFSTDAES